MTPLVASRVPMLVDMVVAELRNHGIDARSRTAAA